MSTLNLGLGWIRFLQTLLGVFLYYILFVQRLWMAPASKGALLNIHYYYYSKFSVLLGSYLAKWLYEIKDSGIFQQIKDMLMHTYIKTVLLVSKAALWGKTVVEAMNQTLPKPANLGGSRWIPHQQNALKILLKSYRPLVAHFDYIIQGRTTATVGVGRAQSILRCLRSHRGIFFCHFLLDVLDVLAIMSMQCQKDDITLGAVLLSYAKTA